MYNMLIRPTDEELVNFGKPDFTIFNAGAFPANRFTSYMSSSTSVDINMRWVHAAAFSTWKVVVKESAAYYFRGATAFEMLAWRADPAQRESYELMARVALSCSASFTSSPVNSWPSTRCR